ncbi:MAG: Integrase [Blastococcus sp.]|nr:Integrase [Blastococcus sp.]
MKRPRRRQAGEGSISEYAIKAGPRFLIKFAAQREDGTRRTVLKRGFKTRRDAAAALRAEIRKSEVGEWVEPSKQRLDAYLAERIQGQRAQPVHAGLLPEEHSAAHRAPPRCATHRPSHRIGGGRLDAAAGGIRPPTVRAASLRARSATCSPSRGRHWAMRSSTEGSPSIRRTGRQRRARQKPAPRRCRRGPRRSSAASFVGQRPKTQTSPWAGDCSRPPGCRGEALALRWRDVDLDAGRLAVRRSVGVVKTKGAGELLVEGPTKTGQSPGGRPGLRHRGGAPRLPGSSRTAGPRPGAGLSART